jgi:hypothetical protein
MFEGGRKKAFLKVVLGDLFALAFVAKHLVIPTIFEAPNDRPCDEVAFFERDSIIFGALEQIMEKRE